MHRKIDECGNYLPFPGYTFIALLKKKDVWMTLYKFIELLPTFGKYYKLLPLDSFHMTIKNYMVMNKNDNVDNMDVVPTGKLQMISDVCKIMNFAPSCEIVNMYTDHSLGIVLKPSDMKNLQKLRDVISVVLGLDPEPNFVYHMTLAYNFKKPTKEDEVVLKKEFEQIFSKIKILISKTSVIDFEDTKLFYFSDMTSYIPY